jgi:uncharacterized RDD family membrane protein YckC
MSSRSLPDVVADGPPADRQGFSALAPASPWTRLAAYLLEYVLQFLTLGIGYIVWWVITLRRGQTPGKSLLNLQCVTADGLPASWGRSFVRDAIRRILLFPGFGLIVGFVYWISESMAEAAGTLLFFGVPIVTCVMVFRGDRRAIWDYAASTMVIDI